jgi:hypothetical protein
MPLFRSRKNTKGEKEMNTSAHTLRVLSEILIKVDESSTLEEAKQCVVDTVRTYVDIMEEEFHGTAS